MPEVLAPGEPGAQDGSEAGTASESGMRSSLLSSPSQPWTGSRQEPLLHPPSPESQDTKSPFPPGSNPRGPCRKGPLDGEAVITGGSGRNQILQDLV